jgi:dsDNA-binding SOS-regulon protein
MAVIVQYIVVRNGEQKMTFTSKKEADAYDKLLDISDRMYTFLESSKLEMGADQLEELAFFIAENREAAIGLLRGGKAGKKPVLVSKSPAEEKKRTSSPRKNAKGRKAPAAVIVPAASGA